MISQNYTKCSKSKVPEGVINYANTSNMSNEDDRRYSGSQWTDAEGFYWQMSRDSYMDNVEEVLR